MLTRRSLLKTTLATGALMAASPVLDAKAWAARAKESPVELKPSMCNGCSSHCGIWVHVKDGRVWKVTGHPDHNRNNGKLCARAHASVTTLYDPDRLRQPMKRVGDTFVPITFKQALDEIAAKLKEILEAHGPGAVFWEQNPRETGIFYGGRFINALGSPNHLYHSATCNLSLISGFGAIYGTLPGADLANSKYILTIGRNPAEGIRTSYTAALAKAIEKGAKVVAVDPRLSVTGGLATEWVPIRPGSDLALLLAIAHVLIKEGLYDAKFVAENTTGFEDWAVAIDTYTPEWAAVKTTIPAAKILQIARELAANAPNCVIDPGWKGGFGTNYNNSTETARTVGAVNALLGNLGMPGGIAFGAGAKMGGLDPKVHPNPPKPEVPRTDGQGVAGEFPLTPPPGLPHILLKKAQEGMVKAGFIRHHNPVRNFPDPAFMKAGFQALDLLVVIDTYMTETAELAHYILPEPSFLEREEAIENFPGGKPTLAMRTQVVPQVHAETMPLYEIVPELARRVGIGEYFNFTLDDLNAARLGPSGISLEEFKQKGAVKFDLPAKPPGMPKLNTPSGKVEFASAKWAKAGFSAVPAWVPTKVEPDPFNPKSFRLIHGKEGFHTHSASANNEYLLQISKEYDTCRLWINAGRARALGIRDGDMVVVRSPLAEKKVKAKVTERLHPEAVYLPMGYGNWASGLSRAKHFGISMNDFVPFQAEPHAGHTMMMEVIVEVEKA